MLIKQHIYSNYYIKRLINTCFAFVTLRNDFDVHAQKCFREKTLRKSEKSNHAQVSHSFKNSFMLENMQKKLAKTKLYK